VVANVEIDETVRRVLNDRHPDVPIKVFDVKNTPFVGGRLDLACVTFPCEDTSIAGPRTGRAHTGKASKVRCIGGLSPSSPMLFIGGTHTVCATLQSTDPPPV
jgi:site-specific DNA-cytosine methylase